MFGSARDLGWALDAQGADILKERIDILGRILADRDPGRRRVADDLVVHVRDVHDVLDFHATEPEKPPQHIDLQKGAEIADVAVVVNRRTAGVHAQGLPVQRNKRVYMSGECIKEMKRHRSWVGLLAHEFGQNPARFGLSDCSSGDYEPQPGKL